MPVNTGSVSYTLRAIARKLSTRHSKTLFRLAYRMTGNKADAEDVVQETFLRAFRQLSHYESRSSFSTWLYRITANYALDLIRVRRRKQERHVDSGDHEDTLDNVPSSDPRQDRLYFNNPLRQRLQTAMNELTDQERTAFVLRHFEGLSIEEIGEILTLGVRVIASRLRQQKIRPLTAEETKL